jgi:hypothetical protein
MLRSPDRLGEIVKRHSARIVVSLGVVTALGAPACADEVTLGYWGKGRGQSGGLGINGSGGTSNGGTSQGGSAGVAGQGSAEDGSVADTGGGGQGGSEDGTVTDTGLGDVETFDAGGNSGSTAGGSTGGGTGGNSGAGADGTGDAGLCDGTECPTGYACACVSGPVAMCACRQRCQSAMDCTAPNSLCGCSDAGQRVCVSPLNCR